MGFLKKLLGKESDPLEGWEEMKFYGNFQTKDQAERAAAEGEKAGYVTFPLNNPHTGAFACVFNVVIRPTEEAIDKEIAEVTRIAESIGGEFGWYIPTPEGKSQRISQYRTAFTEMVKHLPDPVPEGKWEFYLYYPSEEAATKGLEMATMNEFEGELSGPKDDGSWLCLLNKSMPITVDSLAYGEREGRRMAARTGGDYDGWEVGMPRPAGKTDETWGAPT